MFLLPEKLLYIMGIEVPLFSKLLEHRVCKNCDRICLVSAADKTHSGTQSIDSQDEFRLQAPDP